MAFAAQTLTRGQANRAGRPGRAASPAAGRMLDAIEGHQQLQIGVYCAVDLDDLTEASTVLASAAGVWFELLAPEYDRRNRLVDLDRGAAHRARIGRGRQTYGEAVLECSFMKSSWRRVSSTKASRGGCCGEYSP